MLKKIGKIFTVKMVAIIAVAAIAVSCAGKLKKLNTDNLSSAPTQIIENMHAAQTNNGVMKMRMNAAIMERYEEGDSTREYFPAGFRVCIFDERGFMETEIVSDKAQHSNLDAIETWSAFGNVVIKNHIKGDIIETDTLYWDKEQELIWTDCYVKMSSQDGFMQGFGMKSDERARNAQLIRPFDSYGIVARDSVKKIYVDTVNFIGPKNIIDL